MDGWGEGGVGVGGWGEVVGAYGLKGWGKKKRKRKKKGEGGFVSGYNWNVGLYLRYLSMGRKVEMGDNGKSLGREVAAQGETKSNAFTIARSWNRRQLSSSTKRLK